MAQHYINCTNRALSFARIQLKQLEQATESGGWSEELAVGALEAGITFHLAVALHAYRREIAARYSLAAESIATLCDLIEAQQALGQSTSEATEFQVLAEEADSWLNQLEQRYARCWDSSAVTQSQTPLSGEISLVQIESARKTSPELPLSTLYSELYALISRQRGAMQEW